MYGKSFASYVVELFFKFYYVGFNTAIIIYMDAQVFIGLDLGDVFKFMLSWIYIIVVFES